MFFSSISIPGIVEGTEPVAINTLSALNFFWFTSIVLLSRNFASPKEWSTLFFLNKPAIPDIYFKKENPTPSSSWAPHRIFNVGNSQRVSLLDFVKSLEDKIGNKAIKEFSEMQPGDVKDTFSDTKKIENWIDFKPKTPLKEGIKEFIDWYKKYFDY